MKTAEEWYNDPTPELERTRLIQLDAMREGMRRAAEVSRWKHPVSSSAAYYEAKRITETLLAASEQLTDKDL